MSWKHWILLMMVPGAMLGQTRLTGTVDYGDGTPASGTVVVNWPSFTAASGVEVPAGSTSATIGSGGVLTLSLMPNAGSTPIGTYYTAVYHLADGGVTRQYWVVPASASPVPIGTIQATAMPLSVAQQTVSKAYVDTAIATAIAGAPVSESATVAGVSTQASIWNRYVAFGDSITACCYPSVPANLYANRLAADVGVTAAIDARSGDQACDVANAQVFPNENPGDAQNALYTLLIGTNDANIKGAGAYEAVFNLCEQAAIAWLGSSSASRYTGASFATVPTGWSADTTYAAVTGLQTTTPGALSSWPVTTYGGPVAIWYRVIDGNGGTFTYAVDGGSPVAVNGFTVPAIATQNGTTRAVGVALASVAAGTHTVTIKATSPTAPGNAVSVLAVGTPPATPQFQGPKVWVGGTPFQENDTLSLATAAYNADSLANVTLLAGDGFGAQFVDVRRYLLGKPAEMHDGLHPNDLGHQHLEQAFEAAIQPVLNPAAALAAAGGATSTFNGGIVGTPYTASLTDSVIFTSAGTVNLPSAPAGKTYFLSNYGGSPATVTTPAGGSAANASIPAGGGLVVASSGSGLYWIVGATSAGPGSSAEKADFPFALAGTPYTTSASDAIVFTNGGTVNLYGGDPGGKAYFLVNYGSTNATIATTGGGSANGYVLGPNGGVIVVSSGSGKYWAIGDPATGLTGSCPSTTALTVVNGKIVSCS